MNKLRIYLSLGFVVWVGFCFGQIQPRCGIGITHQMNGKVKRVKVITVDSIETHFRLSKSESSEWWYDEKGLLIAHSEYPKPHIAIDETINHKYIYDDQGRLFETLSSTGKNNKNYYLRESYYTNEDGTEMKYIGEPADKICRISFYNQVGQMLKSGFCDEEIRKTNYSEWFYEDGLKIRWEQTRNGKHFRTVKYEYDNLGRLVWERQYGYDKKLNKKTYFDYKSENEYNYIFSFGKLKKSGKWTREKKPNGLNVKFTRDDNNNIIRAAYRWILSGNIYYVTNYEFEYYE